MTNTFAVFDGFGELLTIIRADTPNQFAIALDDFADEHIEGCSLQGEVEKRDWETLTFVGCMSVLFDISGGHELEVKGVSCRDYTHYPSELGVRITHLS